MRDLDAYRPLLNADELERARRFVFERDAARYVVGRGVLRQLLGNYIGVAPAAINLKYGAHGKPALSATSDRHVHFNLAHSGDTALLAVTRDAELGVDVEVVAPFDDMPAVMRVSFSPTEREAIQRLPPDEQVLAFYRCWTRKEAVLKALGWGLARPLDSFCVSISGSDPRLLSMDGEPDAHATWRVMEVAPAPGLMGAAAWRGPPLDTTCYRHSS